MDWNYHRKKIPSNFDKFNSSRIVLVFQTKTSFHFTTNETYNAYCYDAYETLARNERNKNKLERIDKRPIICNINSTRVS